MINAELRAQSFKQAAALGYTINPNLPLLDERLSYRPLSIVIDRCLSLSVAVACSFGFDKTAGRAWLETEGLVASVSPNENEFLKSESSEDVTYQDQVECLQAFVWLLGHSDNLSFDRYCDDQLVTYFPDMKSGSSAQVFRSSSKLRSLDKAVQALDLAYCLHWSIVDLQLNRTDCTASIKPHVVVERRRALEWALGTDEWDTVALDT